MTNRWLTRLGLGVALMTMVGLASAVYSPRAQALACDGWYGRSCWYGYFDNKYDPGINPPGSDVIVGGIQGITSGDKSAFISKIEGYYNDPDAHLHTSGAFIMLSMSGYQGSPGNPGRNVTATQITDWENRVMNPAIQMTVEFARFDCGEANTYYQINENDIAAGTATADEGCDASDQMIDFWDTSVPGGQLVYRIRIACGNPLGQLPGLPDYTPPPPVATTLKCGNITTDPADPEVGQPLTVTATVTVTGGPNQPVTAGSMTIQRQGGTTDIPTITRKASGNTVTLTTQNYSPPINGWYTVAWSATVNNVSISCGGDFKPYSSFDALTYPFFSVQGDIISGVSFATTTNTGTIPCAAAPHNPDAGISSWNRSGNPDFNGAGAEYAAMAMNYMQGFISDTAVGANGLNLSFANSSQVKSGVSSTDSGKSLFGGMFGSVTECVDYWNTKPDLTASGVTQLDTIASAANMNGVYFRNGDLDLTGGSIQNGSHATVYVDGNVEITGPITYQNTGWTDTSQIPTFKLIVHGAIFVDSNVDRLDGLYVAVPDHYDPSDAQTTANNFVSPEPGTITTCAVRGASPFQSYDPSTATVGGAMFTNCNLTLTVYGSFIANQLYLNRISGTLGSNQPAEVFVQSPEMWLAQASTIDPTTGPRYQAVLGLPPVL